MTTVRKLSSAEATRLRRHAVASGIVLERDGNGVYAFGRAEVLRLPNGVSDPAALQAVEDRLMALAAPGTSGVGLPVAVGALPFLPDQAGELVVPALGVVSHGAAGEATAIALSEGDGEALLELLLGSDPDDVVVGGDLGRPPDEFELRSVRPHEEFLSLVAAGVEEVRSGRLEKVVLARDVVIRANRPFRQSDLFERLRSLHPSCLSFAVEGFVGATPELLCRRSSDEVFSDPLAGTAPRSGDPEADRRIEEALLSSEKERVEHRAVVDSISSALSPVMASLEVPDGPEIVELRNVSHLRTQIRGRLAACSEGRRMPNALELVGLIHPTPAVSGSPIDLALEYLAKAENLERDRYAGPVGWLRADGDGEFHIGIRSAIVSGDTARLFAGVGIVADSDPETELRETQLKLQAVLAAAVRP